jgi:hypothetical protein
LQPDASPDNNSDMFGVGFGDSFDEEEQEGDEDMYPLSRNLGEHNFATHFNFADHIDPDKLAPGNSSNSLAECGSLSSHNAWPDNASVDSPPTTNPPPKSTDMMDLFVTEENGEEQNIKCNATSDSYLEEGDPDDYAMFELIRILDSHRCPRILTTEIINWCKYASNQGCTDPASLPKDRRRFVKKMEKSMSKKGVDIPSYKVNWVQLEATEESDRLVVPVITWDLQEQLESLLADQTLFGDLSNLNVNPDNPFMPIPNDRPDISGDWYTDTAKKLGIKGLDGRFLLGLVLGIDKTHVCENGRWTLEPLIVTTTLLKGTIWERPNSWRIIGLIPVLTKKSAAQASIARERVDTKSAPMKNYHACLKVAVESIAKAQSKIGPVGEEYHFTAQVILGQYTRPMDIVCCISHMVVDGEGADKLSARNQIKSGEDGRISRGCDCPPAHADDPYFRCTDFNTRELMVAYRQLQEENFRKPEGKGRRHEIFLKTFHVHPVKNAFWNLDFGATNNAPYKSMKVDPMHAGESGVIEYMVRVLVGKADGTKAHKMAIDQIADDVLRKGPTQSASKNFPRVSFSGGITSLSYMPAHEWPGVLLSLTLLGAMEKHRRRVLSLGLHKSIELKDRLACLEMVLCFHAWMNYGPFDELYEEDGFQKIDECARDIGMEVVHKCARLEGFHYRLQKFHDLFAHLVSDIKHVGSGSVLHMGVVERMHKFFAKIPACTSQFRGDLTFLKQVADRLRESQILTQARYMYQANVDLPSETKHSSAEIGNDNVAPPTKSVRLMSPAGDIAVMRTADDGEPEYKWFGKGAMRHGIHPMVISAIQEAYQMGEVNDDGINVFQLFDTAGLARNRVNLYTEAHINKTYYRNHPDFQQNGGWYDWAMVVWDINPNEKVNKGWQPAVPFWSPKMFRANAKPNEFVLDTSNHTSTSAETAIESEIEGGLIIFVPARILGFLKETIGGRVWAVVHSCQSATRTNSFLTRRWQLSYQDNGKPTIQLVLATTLSCPVFIVEEEPGLRESKPQSDFVYEVSNRRLHWPKIFLHMAKEGVHNFVPSRVKKNKQTKDTHENRQATQSSRNSINRGGKAKAGKSKKTLKRKAPPPVAKSKRTAKKTSRQKGVARKKRKIADR